jgi:cytochrome b6-f complex iron-sulfur subunit
METEQETCEAKGVPRRSFLNWIWASFTALACIELGWITHSILKSPKETQQQEGETIIDAGMITDFQRGSVKAIPQGQFYMACLDDGSFIALSKKCTHLGCSVPWNDSERKFICPCHGSTFDIAGAVLTPPALRPLDYFPVRVENGLIRVDISRPQKRQSFNSSQTVKM